MKPGSFGFRAGFGAIARAGQEETGTPSADYTKVAGEARYWIEKNYPNG